jgi:cytochrome c-type biogenesis protein CcsB
MPSTQLGLLSVTLCTVTTLCYFLAMVSYIVYLVIGKKTVGILASSLTCLGFIIHTSAIGLRWKASYVMGYGHAPLSNLYESIVFFAWTVLLLYGLFEARYKYRSVGAFVLPVAFLTMAFAQYGAPLVRSAGAAIGSESLGNFSIPTGIQALLPALQSDWLLYHVVTCFLGYAGFAVGAAVSIMYLVKAGKEERNGNGTDAAAAGGVLSHFPSSKLLDQINYQAIMIGFPLLTLGIITGAIWANYAWGSYWSWDPKETWSLIVWFIYAAFLHARITRGWVGKRAAILSLVGFSATVFCYLGVNLLLSGLHSYGGG